MDQLHEPLSDLFYRLFMVERCVVHTPYPGSILDFPLYLTDEETANIMPNLAKTVVEKIAKGATSGNTDDMYTLSMMYSVGLGVPESDAHGMSWANFALLGSGPLEFEECQSDLKKHISNLEEYAYPAMLDDIYTSMLPQYKKEPVRGVPEGSYLISPLLAGLRMFVVYRIHKTEKRSYSYLYDVRIGGLDGERVSLDVAIKLDIPNYIGSNGKRLINPDYHGNVSELLSGPANYFVVAGTLTVPDSMKDSIKSHLPEVKSVSALFDYFLGTLNEERRPIVDCPEVVDLLDDIDQKKEKIKRIKDGSELERLKDLFEEARKKHSRAKRKKNYEEAAELKAAASSIKKNAEIIKQGKAVPLLQSKIEKLKRSLDSLRDANAKYRIDQFIRSPENYFRFVASDIYYGSRGNVRPIPVGQHVNRHLQSNGFAVTNDNLFDDYSVLRTKGGPLTEKAYCKYVEKFAERMPDQKVTGIIARPVELGSVNKEQKLPVYIITSE